MLEALEALALRKYKEYRAEILKLEVRKDENLETGSVDSELYGPVWSLSPSEVYDIHLSINWALRSWVSSGALPEVSALRSYVLNSAKSPVVLICTAFCVVNLLVLLLSINSGAEDSDLLGSLDTEVKVEPSAIAPSISLKTPTEPATGGSAASTPAATTAKKKRSSAPRGTGKGKKKKKRKSVPSRK